MARIKKGILGGFSGKVGTVVGASWKTVDYMRGLPRPSNKPSTMKQLAQRNKMALLRGFLLGLRDVIELRFQNISKYTPMNDALSYNMLNTIEGIHPEQSVNFKQLIFSKGDLLGTWSPKVVSIKSNSVDFSWKNGNFTPLCAADDQVTLVVYNPVKKVFCILENAGLREDKASRLLLPEDFAGDTLHCYISFYSENRKLASTNEYLGEITAV
ncbi:hypothetical protein FBD94_01995 [Pedobacter hiemivivus]|uniref:Uncharacterized protein n=1 Tax=Pedobacter hiemivivus TaxID=2530454 RepID=A0A4R0NHB6_9SPHI|nr:DUF6266 family protein [Pedobacter hiemivivus]TCC98702.1 hypothetical protein EZ444_05335 [Pedobacter hiemivivus]TKC65350.1 hypothetical protein FBD94_01995 [Pedobacter hiemivivus]